VVCHFCVSSLGQVAGALNPVTLLSRLGPRHRGQSWAQVPLALISRTQTKSKPLIGCASVMGDSFWILLDQVFQPSTV
jgi:hypothetical protein